VLKVELRIELGVESKCLILIKLKGELHSLMGRKISTFSTLHIWLEIVKEISFPRVWCHFKYFL